MIGIITGSGFYDFASISTQRAQFINTPFGPVYVYNGELEGKEVVFISRHGDKHKFLSSHINHRANMFVFKQYGVEAVFSTTICGVINENFELGQLIFPNDLYYPSNRLPNGELCTLFTKPSQEGRGHAICDDFFDKELIMQLIKAAKGQDLEYIDNAVYGYTDGPRFNSRTEIQAFKQIGVDVISQTIAPEAVLAAELEIPYACMAYGIDYANGIGNGKQISQEALKNQTPKAREIMYQVLLSAVRNFEPVKFKGLIYRFT